MVQTKFPEKRVPGSLDSFAICFLILDLLGHPSDRLIRNQLNLMAAVLYVFSCDLAWLGQIGEIYCLVNLIILTFQALGETVILKVIRISKSCWVRPKKAIKPSILFL